MRSIERRRGERAMPRLPEEETTRRHEQVIHTLTRWFGTHATHPVARDQTLEVRKGNNPTGSVDIIGNTWAGTIEFIDVTIGSPVSVMIEKQRRSRQMDTWRRRPIRPRSCDTRIIVICDGTWEVLEIWHGAAAGSASKNTSKKESRL